MKRKHISSALLFLFALALFAGCGNAAKEPNQFKTGGSTAENTETEQILQGEENPSEEDMADNSVVWVIDNASLAARLQEPLNRLLAEKGIPFTVSIRSVSIDIASDGGTDYYSSIKERKEKGMPTDLIFLPMAQEEDGYYAAVKDGLFAPLALGEDEPALAEALSPFALERTKIDGTPYGLCGLPEYFRFGIGFNQHYLQKYGIDPDGLSGDLQDNEALFREMAQKETDLLTALAYWGLPEEELGYEYLLPSCAVGFSRKNGTEIVNVFAQEQAGAYLEALKRLREQKLVTFLNTDGFGAVEKENGFFAIALHESKAEASALQVGGFVDSDGNTLTAGIWFVPGQGAVSLPVILRGDITGIASWSRHPQEAYTFLKLLYTDPDVANLVKFGEKGVDYQVEDGYITELLTQEINPRANVGYINDVLTYPMQQEPGDKKETWESYFQEQGVHPLAGFQFDPSAVLEEINATNAVICTGRMMSDGYKPEFKKLISADVPDVGQALRELNERLEKAGISEIIAEANRQVQEWMKKKE